MALPNELVRVRVDGVEKNLGRAYAESTDGVEILDEPVRNRDGSMRAETRAGGCPAKPRTTVAKKAAAKKKKAVAKKAPDKPAVTEPATEPKEQDL